MTPRGYQAAVVVIHRDHRSPSTTKEGFREYRNHIRLLPEAAQTDCAALASDQEGLLMKTIACRFEDGLFDLLSMTAELEDTSIADEIRQAVEAHVARKMQSGALAAKATEAMAEIDQEAKDRKAAIAVLIGKSGAATAPGTQPRRRGKAAEPTEPDAAPSNEPKTRKGPMGVAAPSTRSDK